MGTRNVSIPFVIEKTGRGEREYDLFSRLLKDRIIFIGKEIDDELSNIVMGQFLFLRMEDRTQDINLYINTVGGSVTAGLAIYDTMQFVECDVATFCVGQASSMGALLLSAGTKGKRYSLPNARILIHQPLGGVFGAATDIGIHAKELKRVKERLNTILSKHTGQALEKIEKDVDRDFFMSPTEAKDYGIIDEVLTSMKDIRPT
jgi:ATP-dependent Clp protease protease subunit